jgi:hypothetical protein
MRFLFIVPSAALLLLLNLFSCAAEFLWCKSEPRQCFEVASEHQPRLELIHIFLSSVAFARYVLGYFVLGYFDSRLKMFG